VTHPTIIPDDIVERYLPILTGIELKLIVLTSKYWSLEITTDLQNIASMLREKDGRVWHVDHAYPIVHGGDNRRDNKVLSCATCNLSKGPKSAKEFANV